MIAGDCRWYIFLQIPDPDGVYVLLIADINKDW